MHSLSLHDFLIGLAFVAIVISPAIAALNPFTEKHRL